MKVLFIGDQHVKTSNLAEIELLIKAIENEFLQNPPSIIVMGGDLLHTHERLNTVALNKACDFINRMRKIALTYVLVGNHDAIHNGIFLSEDHWLNPIKQWHNVVIVDKIISFEKANTKLIFAPYVPPGRFIEALNTINGWLDANCIFAHQEFKGCKMGHILSEIGDDWPLNYPNVVSGHIHLRHKPQPNIYYSGASIQHAFGESERNSIALLNFDGEMEIKEYDFNLPRKKIVYLDTKEIATYKKTGRAEDSVKITLSGNVEEFKAFKKTKKYKELISDGIKIVFKTKDISTKSINDTKTKEINAYDILISLLEKDNLMTVFNKYIVIQ